MPTNEQRRATAKRKLERQLERRAAKARKRRIYTIVGSAVAAIVVIGAIVATVVITNRDSGSKTASAATTTPTDRRRRRPAAPGQLPAFAAPADLGANCQYPASRGQGEQAGQPAAHRQGADRPGADQRQHGDQPGQHRPAARQRQGAVHGQQLRQPGPAGLLQRHAVPPADHLRGAGGAAVRRPDRPGHRRAGLPVRQRVPDQPVPARRSQAAAAGAVSARHAGDGQRRARAPTAASSSWCTRIRSCRRTTRCSAPSTRPAWPRWTRSPRAAPPTEARTASRSDDVQVKSILLD